ncbi:MAG: peroxidase [Candidatus Acidiferrales bacterium]
MEPIFLKDIEQKAKAGPKGQEFEVMEAQGVPIPQILYLFAFRPRMTDHLSRFTQEVMRGPSPLSPGTRELIAAFTSHRNQCPF